MVPERGTSESESLTDEVITKVENIPKKMNTVIILKLWASKTFILLKFFRFFSKLIFN